MKPDYSINVFINCPFDGKYQPLFHAIVFSVFDCGFVARCALEVSDSSEVRIHNIFKIIEECKYGIHDISRTELDPGTNLPRFNMPLELGLFLGAKRFGKTEQKKKMCIILDKERYRYQSFISDISGQDIKAHKNKETEVIKIIRNWLRNASGRVTIPGGSEIINRYNLFKSNLPDLSKKLKLTVNEMIFNDYVLIVSEWLKINPIIM